MSHGGPMTEPKARETFGAKAWTALRNIESTDGKSEGWIYLRPTEWRNKIDQALAEHVRACLGLILHDEPDCECD